MIIYQDIIKREDLKNNPNYIYLFGDNLVERGFGGQAKEMRGEPNALGIPTKRFPTMAEDAFFIDPDFEEIKETIDRQFSKITAENTVVIPSAGLGTGLAQLDKRAPKIYNYILGKIEELR